MINFFTKKAQAGRVTNCDVLVTYSIITCQNGIKKKSLRYSFSEKAVRMMCGNVFYAMLGFDERYPERIYFCSSNKKNGYKLTNVGNSGKRYQCSFGTNVNYKEPTSFVVEYNLKNNAVHATFNINRNNNKGEK